MKKIIIAAVAIAASVVAQAASINWSNTGGATNGVIYDSTASSTKLAPGMTAYLIDLATIDQADLLTAARGEGFNLASYSVDNATLNENSKIGATTAISYGDVGKEYIFYFAILDSANEQLLISDTASLTTADVGTQTAAFADSKTWSNQAFGDADYSAAGWYSTSVPEPTSGLLLLLGMAGLALKRKHV